MWVKALLVAVMVKVNVPVGDLRLVPTVSVDEPEVLMDAGLKLAVARLGSPLTLRLTVPENPGFAAMVTMYRVLEPRRTLALDGVTEMVKSPETTSATLVVWVKVPLVAVTISG